MTTAIWVPPPIWTVPREWAGERAFVICGGESVNAQRALIPQLRGRVIAVKHGVLLRPDADVLFFAGERPAEIAAVCLPIFTGRDVVVRGKGHSAFPNHAKRIGRPEDCKDPAAHERWSDDPTRVIGFDAGTSAINLALLYGAREVVVLGYDMIGGRWFNGEIQHYLPQPPDWHFQTHMLPLPALAEDARRKGVRIVNVSPISRVECFERGRLQDFL